MSGRFTKYNGATEVIDRGNAWRPKSGNLWRFKPDVYHPFRKPIRSPNLLQYRVERSFGKRIVDQAAKQVARRAPLAALGPLGDLLAAGLITWDMYLLLLELQNQRNPVYPIGDPPDPNDDPYGPPPYDLANPGWYTGDFTSYPSGSWVTTGGEFKLYWNYPDPNYPNLGSNFGPAGSTYQPYQLEGLDGPVDSISTFVPVHHVPSNTDWYWHIHSDWWIDLGVDPGTTYTGHGVPLPIDLPIDWVEPDPNMKRHFFPDGIAGDLSSERGPDTESQFKRGPRWKPPRPSRPKRGTREAPKAQGPLQTVMNAMDIVSEAAEFVDGVYDALPKDVRDRWDQKGRGLMDNAGQYGIDGADWKLNAIWHNWRKIDVEQAVKNIIANELQDKILGMYQRSLPKNIGHVADAGSLGLNDLIKLFNDTIGLS